MHAIDDHFRLEASAWGNERVEVDDGCAMAGRYFPNDGIGRFDLRLETRLGAKRPVVGMDEQNGQPSG